MIKSMDHMDRSDVWGQFYRLVVWIWGSVLLTGCLDMGGQFYRLVVWIWGVSFIDWLSGYGGQFY